jgi:hypothetical protein
VLSGSAAKLEIEASGASQLEAGHLQVTNARVGLSGASQATVAVSQDLSATVSGASQLRYVGEPTFARRDVSGASRIMKD